MICLIIFVEQDWRDKQKAMDILKDTVDRQKRDLENMRKEIRDKDMLCSALKVSIHLSCFISWPRTDSICNCDGMFWSLTETDDVYGNAAK